MTPLYNGNEYYKKMLDLQERLRKSEEERIRLEERFSLLEHESRSRHETCINRLRMRYIDFLEEQQARDERNHQLLGALDRVDSSLALMSAKTDRLGALRKQYEASILSPCENRRPNGSPTGDSGVASQNDERQRICDASLRRNNVGNESSFRHRVDTIDRRQHQRRESHRSSESPSQVRSGSSSPYANARSGIRRESSQFHQPSLAFSRFTQGGTSLPTRRNDDFATRLLDNVSASPGSLLSTKNSPFPRRATNESFNGANVVGPRISSSHDLRNADDDASRSNANRPLRQNRQVFLPAATSKYDGSVAKYSNDFLARFDNSHGRVNPESSSKSKPEPERSSIFTAGRGGNDGNRAIASRSPKLSAILREELGDGEENDGEADEDDYVGGIVENQLERYISKIRSLHRVTEPRSIEEIDHDENNTSGDLLNVTLSDDAVDLPIEERLQPREDSFPRELGNVLALANDLADRTAASATNVANNICQDVGAAGEFVSADERPDAPRPLVVSGVRRDEIRENGPVGESVAAHRLASIDGLHDRENLACRETLESLAKNGIGVARSATELASRPTTNIQDIAKIARSPGTRNEDGRIVSVRDPPPGASVTREDARISSDAKLAEKRDESLKAFSVFSRLDESSRGLVSGEQRENDENLDEALEELEPWNLSALERRVQEIILKDEAHNDFVDRDIARNVDHGYAEPNQFEDGATEVGEESKELPVGDRRTGECDDETDHAAGTDSPRDDDATRLVNERDTTDEPGQGSSRQNKEDSQPEEQQAEGLLSAAEESTREKDEAPSRERGNRQATNPAVANEADPGIEYGNEQADYASRENESYGHRGEYFEDPNVRYEYSAEGRYDPNERYDLNENSRYDGYQGERYEYAEGHYDEAPDRHDCTQGPVDQREYAQSREEYVRDPSQLEYIRDPDQQYEGDPINERYGTNPADQRYEADLINEEYDNDPAEQRYEADLINERYSADPAHQRYEADPINERYSGDPADQRYEADPIDERYAADPADQRYEADPIDERYATNPADRQYEASLDERYDTDPNQLCVADPDQSYSVDPNQPYALDGDERYPEASREEDPADFNARGNADQPYATDEQRPEKSGQRYLNDPGREYSARVDPRQNYSAEADYAQDEIREYPSATTEYPRPTTREYPNTELRGREESNLIRESEENVEESLEPANAPKVSPKEDSKARKSKDVIKSILDSDTESTIERNASNTESDFDFN